jgi:hypothetical protein
VIVLLYNGEYSSDNNPDDPYRIAAAAVHEINWLTAGLSLGYQVIYKTTMYAIQAKMENKASYFPRGENPTVEPSVGAVVSRKGHRLNMEKRLSPKAWLTDIACSIAIRKCTIGILK